MGAAGRGFHPSSGPEEGTQPGLTPWGQHSTQAQEAAPGQEPAQLCPSWEWESQQSKTQGMLQSFSANSESCLRKKSSSCNNGFVLRGSVLSGQCLLF